jgi:hypothetical protein
MADSVVTLSATPTSTTPLTYDTLVDTTTIENVLLINSNVKKLNTYKCTSNNIRTKLIKIKIY